MKLLLLLTASRTAERTQVAAPMGAVGEAILKEIVKERYFAIFTGLPRRCRDAKLAGLVGQEKTDRRN